VIAEQITDLIPYFPRLRGDFELICEVLAAPLARGKPGGLFEAPEPSG
jgi:hypothetical protein